MVGIGVMSIFYGPKNDMMCLLHSRLASTVTFKKRPDIILLNFLPRPGSLA